MQAVAEGRRSLRVAGCRRSRCCLPWHIQLVGDVGGGGPHAAQRQINVGTVERSTEFRHAFFDRIAFGPETFGAGVARRHGSGAVQCVVSWARAT